MGPFSLVLFLVGFEVRAIGPYLACKMGIQRFRISGFRIAVDTRGAMACDTDFQLSRSLVA